MTEFGYLTLFVLSFVLFPCEGQITSPSDGTNFTFLPGSTEKIQWKFDNDIKTVLSRIWYFTGSDGSESLIARIVDDDDPREIPNNTLSGVTIEKPATLVLKNVDKRYNGKYRFQLSTTGVGGVGGDFRVVVFIAAKPNVSINCSNPVTVNEGNDLTCVCRSEGGNPPANRTWYKDGEQIGDASYGENILPLTNVTKQDNETIYMCKAQSFTLTDEKSIEIIVNFKPENTTIMITPKSAVVNGSVNITCNSYGFPEPSYNITHNDTVLITDKKYTIDDVQQRHAGIYKCIATNRLGSDSAYDNLTVIEKPTKPNVTICSNNATVNEGNNLTCACTSKGGKPPASLTWYKDGKPLRTARKGENILTLTNVTKQNSGIMYTCKARSFTLTDEKSIKIIVNFKPENTEIVIKQQGKVGKPVTIKCNSEGRPEPSYRITRDGTVVSTGKMYFISATTSNDEGTYTCIAWNNLEMIQLPVTWM